MNAPRADRRSLLKNAGVGAALAFLAMMLVWVGNSRLQRLGWWNPLIAGAPLQLDLGRIPADSKQRCEFRLTNGGQRPLRIERIRVGCSACLKVSESPPGEIPPGGNAAIVAEFMSHGLTGPIIRTLAVHSNDPTQPILILKIKSEIQPGPAGAEADSPQPLLP